jgi:ribosome modulation factor
MDGWEIARKDRVSLGKQAPLAAARAHLKGPLAALAGRARP